MAIAYLCLGSNKGDRIGYIQQAVRLRLVGQMVDHCTHHYHAVGHSFLCAEREDGRQ